MNTVYRHEYAIKDHLGNIRLWVSDLNGNGIVETPSEILQEKHYYPFGMAMEGPWMQSGVNNKYQYNGKELNEEFGLDLMDYGARWYDPAAARWWSVDPLAETMANWSGYNYGFNNPINMTDPTGMAPVGADGMTNEQWIKASNPWNSSELTKKYREENRRAEVGVNLALSQYWNPRAGEETSREYDEENRTIHIRYSGAYMITGGGSYCWKRKPTTPVIFPEMLMKYPAGEGAMDWINVINNGGNRRIGKVLVDWEGNVVSYAPTMGMPPDLGGKTVVNVFMKSKQLVKVAKETFKNKNAFKKIIHQVTQLSTGNGSTSKHLFKNVWEMKDTSTGARTYFRTMGNRIEILGQSYKKNQQKAINEIKKFFNYD